MYFRMHQLHLQWEEASEEEKDLRLSHLYQEAKEKAVSLLPFYACPWIHAQVKRELHGEWEDREIENILQKRKSLLTLEPYDQFTATTFSIKEGAVERALKESMELQEKLLEKNARENGYGHLSFQNTLRLYTLHAELAKTEEERREWWRQFEEEMRREKSRGAAVFSSSFDSKDPYEQMQEIYQMGRYSFSRYVRE